MRAFGPRLGHAPPAAHRFVPLIGNVRISIAIFSYNGGLYFGITGNYDSSGDMDVLTKGVERGVAELLRASQPAGRKREVAPKPPKCEAGGTRSTDKPPTERA